MNYPPTCRRCIDIGSFTLVKMNRRKTSRDALGQALIGVEESERQDDRSSSPSPLPSAQAHDHQHYEAGAEHSRTRAIDPAEKIRSTSVTCILRRMAVGDPVGLRGEKWKLTRAFVHLENSWKGRVSSCPDLDNPRARRLYKIRSHLRHLDFLLVHLLMALSLIETPAWCVLNKKCFWRCYPDFSENWHLDTKIGLVLEACMLVVLVGIAALDLVRPAG